MLVLTLALAGCSDDAPVTTHRLHAFDGPVDLSLVRTTQARSEQAAALIRQDLAILERDWIRPDGPLQRVNRLLATGEPFVPPPSVLPLVRLARQIASRSGGTFNPGAGGLTALWGFDRDSTEPRPPPNAQSIADVVGAQPDVADIRLEGLEMQGANPRVRLDLRHIARGAAIDLAVARLRQLGIRDAQVQIGGRLRAIGDRAGRPWRIPILKASGAGVLGIVELSGDEAMATAAERERNFIHNGVAYHDILDPRTGWPARGTQAATVLARDAASADAAATALFVAGPAGWEDVARALGVRYALLTDDRGTVHISPELRGRLELVDAQARLALGAPLTSTPAKPAKP